MKIRRSTLRWLSLAMVVACAGDVTAPEPEHASLKLNTTALSFTAVQNGDSAVQSINVTSSSGAPVAWSAVENVPWLTVTPSSGTTPATVTVVAKGDGMSPGTHSGLITITPTVPSGGTAQPPLSVSVELKLAPAPFMTLNPTTLNFTGSAGRPVADAQSVIINTGEGVARSWSATPSASWITLSPSSGTGTGAFAVKVDATGLAAGTYLGSITVAAPATGNSPQTLPVVFVVAPRYTITVAAAPPELGAVSGGGTYAAGENATVVATPAAGAEFVSWMENGIPVTTAPTYTFFVGANRTLTANFRSPLITIATSAAPANGGSTSGGGGFAAGASVSVVATPNAGFTFSSWTENGVVVSTSATYTFSATTNRVLVANFSPAPLTYNIVAVPFPAGAGTTSGGGMVAAGSNVTVLATPATGFSFTNWTENGVVVSSSASYSFTVTGNRSLVANFAPVSGGSFTITTSSNPSTGGTTTGAGSYSSGANATVTATPASGYTFTNWTENGTVVSSNATYTFSVSANRTLVANFVTSSGSNVLVSTSSNPSTGGTTSGGGTYAAGSSVTVTAAPNSGFAFQNWSENGAVVSTSTSYTFTASAGRALVANFSASGEKIITVLVDPTGAGTTSGGGSYTPGTRVDLVATPKPGYLFRYWTLGTSGGGVASYDRTYPITVGQNDQTYVASFVPESQGMTVSVSASPPEAGSVTGGGLYAPTSRARLVATENLGYRFLGWYEGTTLVFGQPTYDLIVGRPQTLTARFEAASYRITTRPEPVWQGSTSGDGTYLRNATVTVTARPASGFRFVNWNGNALLTNPSYTFTAISDADLVAHFTPASPSIYVNTSASPTPGGITTGDGLYQVGSTVTVTATPNTGYTFLHWVNAGTVVSTNASYSFTAPANANQTLLAVFQAPANPAFTDIRIDRPVNDYGATAVPDEFDVWAFISSRFAISSLQATVGSQTTTLGPPSCKLGGFTCTDWGGTVNIASQPLGVMTLVLTITDVNGNVVRVSRGINHYR